MLKKLAPIAVEFIYETIHNLDFKLKHRVSENDFKRERKLPFTKIMLLLIKKSVKSLQLVLNELVLKLGIDDMITASAFSQARRKLRHTAFIELSAGLVRKYYEHKESIKRWKGFRVSGIDGSKIRLPDGPEIKSTFGTFKISYQKKHDLLLMSDLSDQGPEDEKIYLDVNDNNQLIYTMLAPQDLLIKDQVLENIRVPKKELSHKGSRKVFKKLKSEILKELLKKGHILQKEPDREYSSALASVCYDVLNKIVISAELAPAKAYEVAVAKEHCGYLGTQDLVVLDRGYASFNMMAFLTKAGINFVIRCPESFLKESNEMFNLDGSSSKVVTINVPKIQRANVKEENLPEEIKIRFVRVVLSTGEIEVLATSLLDKKTYLTTEFKELYWLRWGVETLYGTVKSRLNLENFTGKSAETVRQDFYSTIFLCNLETIITEEAQENLKEKAKDAAYPKSVNKAVSFNAIKNCAFELFYEGGDISTKLKKLTQLFLMNPIALRKERIVQRKKIPSYRSLDYQRRINKTIF